MRSGGWLRVGWGERERRGMRRWDRERKTEKIDNHITDKNVSSYGQIHIIFSSSSSSSPFPLSPSVSPYLFLPLTQPLPYKTSQTRHDEIPITLQLHQQWETCPQFKDIERILIKFINSYNNSGIPNRFGMEKRSGGKIERHRQAGNRENAGEGNRWERDSREKEIMNWERWDEI